MESGLTVNLPLMLRKGWMRAGCISSNGSLTWSRNGERYASIGYSYDLSDPDTAWLQLEYTRTTNGREPEKVEQRIRLTTTRPNYGGRRWWMICPYSGRRVAKLHMPSGGDRFASRVAWRLGYRSQRVAARDQPFEKMFRLQRKLGCEEGCDSFIFRPKGMWKRTFDRHLERFWKLDQQCQAEMMAMVTRLRQRIG